MSRFDKRTEKANPIQTAEQYGLLQAVRQGKARVKGISQVLADEMIARTPSKWRSKFATELAKKKRNPVGPFSLTAVQGLIKHFSKYKKRNPTSDLEEVEEMSRQFHGREPKETIDVTERESFDPNQTVLADLHELGILGSDFKTKYIVRFKKDRPFLTCDGDGENIEIIGGDQSLEIDDGKRIVPLGFSYCVVYETDKWHLEDSNGTQELYEHFWGEEFYRSQGYKVDDYKSSQDYFDDLLESGVVMKAIEKGYLPLITYDREDEKLGVVGGKYKVEDVGIKD